MGRRGECRVMPCVVGILGFGSKQRETWLWVIFFSLFREAPLVLEPIGNTLITPILQKRNMKSDFLFSIFCSSETMHKKGR